MMDFQDSDPMSDLTNSSDGRCWLVEKRRYNMDNNTSVLYIDLGSDYNGIPEVLLLSVILFVVGIFAFTIMRRWVWNYGRIALHKVPSRKELAKDYNVFSHLVNSPPPSRNTPVEEDSDKYDVSVTPPLDYYDTGFFSWLSILFRLRDVDILRKCGPDALQYGRFQRMVTAYLCIVMVFCLIVILPLNLTGTYLTSNTRKFDATTIGNIYPNSAKLWVHCLTTVVYLFLCYWIMQRFMTAKSIMALHGDEEALNEATASTIMINGLPSGVAGRTDLITKFFSESYPEFGVVSVQFAYDVKELSEVERKLEVAKSALEKVANSNDDPLITPHRCGMISCCCRQVHASTYYEQEVSRLGQLREELKSNAEGKPLPFCLVTFNTEEQAQMVVADFQIFSCGGLKAGRGFYGKKTSTSRDLRTHSWMVKRAPKATDIKWEYLSIRFRTLRWIFVNLMVFIVLFLFSTPSTVMNVWYRVGEKLKMPQQTERSPFLAHVVPSLILLASTTLLPYVIAAGEEFTYHTTRSGKNLALMTKTFVFMLFMVLILPSFGLQSGYTFMSNLFQHKYYTDRWQCIFMPDNGAFFVNFLISTTLIGLVLELLRSAHLAYYMYRMCKVASKFELESARQASIFPFPFGLNYAYMLVIFAITIVYSVVCPLITIFGLLYFVLKYLVDRYNMYFVYDTAEISPRLHRRAVDFLLLSCLLSQLVLLAFVTYRSGYDDNVNYPYAQIGVMIAIIILSFMAYTGHLTMGCLPKWISDYYTSNTPSHRDTIGNHPVQQSEHRPPEDPHRQNSNVELNSNNMFVAPSSYGSVSERS